jgi:uncharacterized protein (TIGR04255 family)
VPLDRAGLTSRETCTRSHGYPAGCPNIGVHRFDITVNCDPYLRARARLSGMTSRPTDLPDFASPPIGEVSLGVQFNSLEGLLAPHLGLIWADFRASFPLLEQHPPLLPVFETFTNGGTPSLIPQLQILTSVPTPRVFFINSDRTELLQVQRDRFHHNWRKVAEGVEYPRFEKMLGTFEAGLTHLTKVIADIGLGQIVPNQCELTYVNHLTVPAGTKQSDIFAALLKPWLKAPMLSDLGAAEDGRVMLRYIIRDKAKAPIGRLTIGAEPARKLDGTDIVQMTLVARGKPKGDALGDVSEFLKLGRRHIVKSFDEITSPEMHKIWGKK